MIGTFLGLVVENEVAAREINPLVISVQHGRVVVSAMSSFISVQEDVVAFAPAAALLRGPGDVFPRIRLQR